MLYHERRLSGYTARRLGWKTIRCGCRKRLRTAVNWTCRLLWLLCAAALLLLQPMHDGASHRVYVRSILGSGLASGVSPGGVTAAFPCTAVAGVGFINPSQFRRQCQSFSREISKDTQESYRTKFSWSRFGGAYAYQNSVGPNFRLDLLPCGKPDVETEMDS